MVGKLIVFEGVEGCGKTTQLQRSREWLQSLPASELGANTESRRDSLPDKLFKTVVITREPGGTELGLKLRRLLLATGGEPIQEKAELLLYAADRAQHIEEVLRPQLALGAIILSDRYTDSTLAYQGYGRGLSLNLIQQLNQIATGGLESDLTLWLDVDVEVGLARAQKRGVTDRIEQADLSFHRRVQQGYRELFQRYSERIVRVDANLSELAVQEQIQSILYQRLIGQ